MPPRDIDPKENEGFAVGVECWDALLNPDDPDYPDPDYRAKRYTAAIMLHHLFQVFFREPDRAIQLMKTVAASAGAKVF